MDAEAPVEILLVEDSPSDAELTIRALRQYNLANRVFVVHDGQEALDYLFGEGDFAGRTGTRTPKVVFLDLHLPKVDGFEVLARIRANPRTRTLPVVILTSSQEEGDVVRGYGSGGNSYVVKPVDFEQFVKAVADLGLYWLVLNRAASDVADAVPMAGVT